MAASFLYTTFAVGPMPPDTEKTSGEKQPCSNSHSLIVGPSFFLFVSSVACCHWERMIGMCEWIKNPYVEKCTLSIVSPETLRLDVETCSFFDICCSVTNGFTRDML